MRTVQLIALTSLIGATFAACSSYSSDVEFDGANSPGSVEPEQPGPIGADGTPLPPDTKTCSDDNPCEDRQHQCINGGCFPATANDGVRNGTETDVDCGGGTAPRCADGKRCTAGTDCTSRRCVSGVCGSSSPNDGIRNGTETDVDCGGDAAPPCADNKRCRESSDCTSLVCNVVCQAPTGRDGVQNGDETDVDCGGANEAVPRCAENQRCRENSDCADEMCENGSCRAPRFDDGIRNGGETDVDCGGPNANEQQKCAVGQRCLEDRDCQSDGCIREGARANTCASARSCTVVHGGFTCGAGEADGENPAAAHEDCCTSIQVPGYSEDDRPGQQVYLDKYEITAGRIREFLRRISAQTNNGAPDVKSWLEANVPQRWGGTWTQFLPSDSVGGFPAIRLTNRIGGGQAPVGVSYALSYAQYVYAHSYNCLRHGGGEFGAPTYWFDAATLGGLFYRQLPRAPENTRQILDQKSINCIPSALLAAFCAWDGGQLATAEVIARVATGGLPAQDLANTSSDGGGNTQYNYPILAGGAAAYGRDAASRIAAPGRMTRDATRYSGAGPWMDLRGNLNETVLCKSDAPTLSGPGLDRRTTTMCAGSAYVAGETTWFGLASEGYGYSSARAGGSSLDANLRMPENKTAYAGGRCMRFR